MLQRIDEKWVRGKYLNYHDDGPIRPGRPTHIFSVTIRETGAKLGDVKWFARWRKYCWYPLNAVFDEGCQREIADFLRMVTTEHKDKRQQEKEK